MPTAQQRSEANARIAAKMKAAEPRWKKIIEAKQRDTLRTPVSCFRFETNLTTDPRSTDEYRVKAAAELGLDEEEEALDHLSKEDRAVILEVLRRKLWAFHCKDTPRTCVRAFQHDVVLNGLPVRGFPITLQREEAAFVEHM